MSLSRELQKTVVFEYDFKMHKEAIEFGMALESSHIKKRFQGEKTSLKCVCEFPNMVLKGYTSFTSSMFGARIMSIIPMI